MDDALAVSGIPFAELVTAKSLESVVQDFHQMFCGGGIIPILSGWNVWFDVMFLKSMYYRTNTLWPFGHRFLDVQSVAMFLSHFRATSQEKMIRSVLGESQTHRALQDARHTAMLLRFFAKNHTGIEILVRPT
ncbi:MAG: hypothetical protein H8K03_12170 [Nitrospira sp.]